MLSVFSMYNTRCVGAKGNVFCHKKHNTLSLTLTFLLTDLSLTFNFLMGNMGLVHLTLRGQRPNVCLQSKKNLLHIGGHGGLSR